MRTLLATLVAFYVLLAILVYVPYRVGKHAADKWYAKHIPDPCYSCTFNRNVVIEGGNLVDPVIKGCLFVSDGVAIKGAFIDVTTVESPDCPAAINVVPKNSR